MGEYIIEFEIDVFQIFLHLGAIFHGDSSTNPLVRPPTPCEKCGVGRTNKTVFSIRHPLSFRINHP